MIYGVTIVLNDCNFSLKDRSKQVQERFAFSAFFTNKQVAADTYDYYLKRVLIEKKTVYGKYELRGRCEFYKAEIREGRVMEHGKNIKSEKI